MAKQQSKGTRSSPVHLCDLVNEGKFVQIKSLAEDPGYMCMACGRLADNSENLCNPVDVDQIGISAHKKQPS